MGARLLLIDDDRDLLTSVRAQLTELGYSVDTASNGEEGLTMALDQHYQLIMSDVMMPGRNGFDVCREIRFHGSAVPFLFLTGQGDVLDRVVGLEIGADDYLVKPFHPRELIARVEALLRRANRPADSGEPKGQLVTFGPLTIDHERMKVSLNGEEIHLTPNEFRLLEMFLSSPGRVFSRDDIRNGVWGYSNASYDQTVTTAINRLRQKIEPAGSKVQFIHAVRGVGYRFAELAELNTVE